MQVRFGTIGETCIPRYPIQRLLGTLPLLRSPDEQAVESSATLATRHADSAMPTASSVTMTSSYLERSRLARVINDGLLRRPVF